MNIFVVDVRPEIAARQLCNRHIIKMPSETVNLLLWPFKLQGIDLPKNENGETIRLSHLNHPCSIFTRLNSVNYNWVWSHYFYLCAEYKERYKRTHGSFIYNQFILENYSKLNLPYGDNLTDFPRCFGNVINLEDSNDICTVDLYHKYYWLDKQEFARWPSIDKIPSWWYGGKNEKWVDSSFQNGVYTKR
jgi:hypothetical protein